MAYKSLVTLENIIYIERAGEDVFFVAFDSIVTEELQFTVPVYTEQQNVSKVFRGVVQSDRNTRRQVKNQISKDQAKALVESLKVKEWLVFPQMYTTEPEGKNFWRLNTNKNNR